MKHEADSVEAYLAGLPDDRAAALSQLRGIVRACVDPRIEERIQYGMIGYAVPHSVYPAGYHCDPRQPLPFLSMASQKSHMALYLFCLYTDPQRLAMFIEQWKNSGKKLDMGRSCVRFKRPGDVPLEVVSEMLRRLSLDDFIASYEASLPGGRSRRG